MSAWTLELYLLPHQAENVGLPHGSIAYIKHYDVNAFGGIGACELTTDLSLAIRWPSFRDAMQAWQEQSTIRPIRGDGQPNRPLTAYTVTLKRIED